MGSGASSSVRGENMGILPRVVDELYTQLEAAAAERGSAKGKDYRVTCSLLEVYNEALRDLQTPMEHDATDTDHATSVSNNSLALREQDGVIVIPGLTETTVATAEEVMQLMDSATQMRSVGATKMNEESSRSHMICTLTVTWGEGEDGGDGEQAALSSRLTFVDLAGSERLKRLAPLERGCARASALTVGFLHWEM